MKKSRTICLIIVMAAAVTAAVGISIWRGTKVIKVGTFSLRDYVEAIDYHNMVMDMPEERDKFPEYLGGFDNAEELCDLAHESWAEMFDDLAKYQKPYTVDYDAQTDTWLVSGCLSRRFTIRKVYRRAYMIVNGSDGKVIAAWADRD